LHAVRRCGVSVHITANLTALHTTPAKRASNDILKVHRADRAVFLRRIEHVQYWPNGWVLHRLRIRHPLPSVLTNDHRRLLDIAAPIRIQLCVKALAVLRTRNLQEATGLTAFRGR